MSRRQVQLGKHFEAQIAGATNGTRVIRQSFNESAPDIEHPLFLGECKVRQSLAIARWIEQAESYTDARPAVLFVREKGARLDDSIVCVRLPVFQYLMQQKERTIPHESVE